MDGQRENEVILEVGQKKCSDDIRRAGEKLIKCITDPEIGRVGVVGFNGVAKWRIVEYATQKLKGSLLFDMQILVQLPLRDFSNRRVLVKEIGHQLGLTPNLNPNYDDDDEDSNDEQRKLVLALSDIYRSLMGRRSLIILGDASAESNFGVMEIVISKEYSKVVMVGDDTEGWECDESIDLDELSNDMLLEETAASTSHFSWVGDVM